MTEENRQPQENDEYFVKKAAEGNAEAFEYIIKKYKGMVVTVARTFYLQGGDEEDILQEGNIGLFKAVKNYSENKGMSFSSFAYENIRSQIINAIKQASRKKNMILNESVDIENHENIMDSESNVDPAEIMVQYEESVRIAEELKKLLTKKEYAVLGLLLSDKNYSETAEILHMEKKSVDNARTRIKKKIMTVLEDTQS